MPIKHRITGKVLFEAEAKTQKELLLKAVSDGADLQGANLEGAYLDGANLRGANLEGAKTKLFIIQGTRHKLQANRDSCKVGCVNEKWYWWTDENISILGEKYDYTPAQITEYKEYIEFARNRAQWGVKHTDKES